ncbi:hypothetical protein [Fontibacillus sp. BL9]|uniref:hypothetical protein n=1 Tax=Fontibacillus sp. BL9 TaxID=3389971 RepID=UPI003979B829
MPILRIKSMENGKVDSRYIQSLDLELSNLGRESFEFLLLGYAPKGLVYRGLHHLGQGSTVFIPRINTDYAPFDLLVVTNASTYMTTGLTLKAWNQEQYVALFTQEDAIRDH